jgi:hypothetical protein
VLHTIAQTNRYHAHNEHFFILNKYRIEIILAENIVYKYHLKSIIDLMPDMIIVMSVPINTLSGMGASNEYDYKSSSYRFLSRSEHSPGR